MAVQYVSLNLIVPTELVMRTTDIIDLPILIKNKDTELKKVLLTAVTNTSDIKATFTGPNYFESIPPYGILKTNVTLLTENSTTGRFTVIVMANITKPKIVDEATIDIDLTTETITASQTVVKELVFVADLFKEHPECLELQELLDQAQEALRQGSNDKANSLVKAAMDGCKEIITSEEIIRPITEAPIEIITPESPLYLSILLSLIAISISIYIVTRPRKGLYYKQPMETRIKPYGAIRELIRAKDKAKVIEKHKKNMIKWFGQTISIPSKKKK